MSCFLWGFAFLAAATVRGREKLGTVTPFHDHNSLILHKSLIGKRGGCPLFFTAAGGAGAGVRFFITPQRAALPHLR